MSNAEGLLAFGVFVLIVLLVIILALAGVFDDLFTPVDCTSNSQCKNAGTCKDNECECASGYSGKNCRTVIAPTPEIVTPTPQGSHTHPAGSHTYPTGSSHTHSTINTFIRMGED